MSTAQKTTFIWGPLFLIVLASFLFVQPHESTASRNATPLTSISNPPSQAVQSMGVYVQFFEAYEVTSGVSLTWMAISQNDIEGYRLYRKGGRSSLSKAKTPQVIHYCSLRTANGWHGIKARRQF